MPTERSWKRAARAEFQRLALSRRALLALVAGACVKPPAPPAAAIAPPPVVAPPLPFDQAVLTASNTLFSLAPVKTQPQLVVIDPLVDGVTGQESVATQTISTRISSLAREKYPNFNIVPFTPQVIGAQPYVMIGTFTPVNAQNESSGERDAFRFCLVMADLRSGKVVAKTRVFARPDGVDTAPLAIFADSPAWTEEPHTAGYIDTCQNIKVGDPVNPLYLDGILTASIISEAMDAYGAGRYDEALALYTTASTTPAGKQLRVYNGLYLANEKLGRTETAALNFAELVKYGFGNGRLGVKILFNPGSTVLDRSADQPYDMWLQQIAQQAARSSACLEIVGNTSKSGSPELNLRISQMRAEYIKARLLSDEPSLENRIVATGVGSAANLVGTGVDNASDALDRRVDFKVTQACPAQQRLHSA